MTEVGIHPNLIAYAALLIWPCVALFLYSTLPIGRATLWTILGAYLLLPMRAEIKFDMVPAFDKETIPSLAALICCGLVAGRWPKFLRGIGLVEIFVFVVIVGRIITATLNPDEIRFYRLVLPGTGPYDGLSAAVAQFLFMMPFFLGREFLRRPEDNVEVLRAMVIAGLAYTLPMLFEIRMSPELHEWVYGYFPQGSFMQQIRYGGYRPIVFIGSGLGVSFFIATTLIAAAAFWRTHTPLVRLAPGAIVAYLGVILALCKTVSGLAYAAVLVPLVRWANPRVQIRVATILTVLALTYPILRTADLVPTNSLLEVANVVSPERAASLQTRFYNEHRLLERAWLRPWFGWGRFGRSRIYDETGADTTISDGHWVITLGSFGLVGFLAEFGLLGLAIFRTATAIRYVRNREEGVYLGALTFIVAMHIINLIPNSSITPWSWLLVGALLGRAEALKASARRRAPLEGLQPSLLRVQDTQTPQTARQTQTAR